MKISEKKWTSLMKKLSLILLSLLVLSLSSTISTSSEKNVSGKAKVVDGDTIKINKKKLDFLVLMHQKRIKFVKKYI